MPARWSVRGRAGSLYGVRAYLRMLVVACVLPAAAIASLTLWYSYSSGRAQLVRKAQIDARSMVHAVDGTIDRTAVGLLALATSPSLASGDLAAFEAQSRHILPYLSGNNIVLTDASGQQRINTIVPEGRPLPRHGNPEFQQQVLAGGAPRVSDLFVGGALKVPLVAVEVPVSVDGRVGYSLAMGFLPERFATILAGLGAEPERIVSIFDSSGTIVARTHEPKRFVGKPGAPALLAAMKHAREGAVETETLEGVPVIAVFARSPVTEWSVAIGVPKHALLAQLEREVMWVALAMLGLFAIGLYAAGVIARRISASFSALVEPAIALGEGQPVVRPRLAIREAVEVAAALEAAQALLKKRTLQLDAANRVTDGLRRRARHLEHAAHHDALTQLPNRAFFAAALDAKVDQARRRGERFTVLFVDVDNFKPVNDRHGHAVGDQLLHAFAARLVGGVRERDLVARLGGDEFALLIDEHSPAQAMAMARGLVDRLSQPYHLHGLTVEVSASIGASGYPEDGTTGDQLLQAADAAMYRTKGSGGRGFSNSGLSPLS